MSSDRYIITNIAYGTGPYLRITDLAMAINEGLAKQGNDGVRIVLPLIYGQTQKRVLEQEFGGGTGGLPDALLLDETLGDLCGRTFYGEESFEDYLARWAANVDEWSDGVNAHLRTRYGDDVLFELARAPRLSYDLSPSYYTSFARLSEIYRRAISDPDVSVADTLLRTVASRFEDMEAGYDQAFLVEPGTFGPGEVTDRRAGSTRWVPPLATPPHEIPEPTAGRGVYVTVTGIPGLGHLYEEFAEQGYQMYTNYPDAVPDAIEAPPWIISRDEIEWHFARPGWGSIWLSIFTETPLLVPEWHQEDDLEIYFNTKRLRKLGIATVYRGQPLVELERAGEYAVNRMRDLKDGILDRHGTLEGIPLVAQSILTRFLKHRPVE